jgi:hypothetical protein
MKNYIVRFKAQNELIFEIKASDEKEARKVAFQELKNQANESDQSIEWEFSEAIEDLT